jgi:hypothetical protein
MIVKLNYINEPIHNSILLFLAPCAYAPEKVQLDHGPSYTFGTKVTHEKFNNNPGMLSFYFEFLLFVIHTKKNLIFST